MGPQNRFQGMYSASLYSLAGRYDNPLPPRFALKIPALGQEISDCIEDQRHIGKLPGSGSLQKVSPNVGLEPTTLRLRVSCSTD